MPRAIWSGAISFGLVNVPVRMFSAIDEQDLRFHLIHEPDGGRIGHGGSPSSAAASPPT